MRKKKNLPAKMKVNGTRNDYSSRKTSLAEDGAEKSDENFFHRVSSPSSVPSVMRTTSSSDPFFDSFRGEKGDKGQKTKNKKISTVKVFKRNEMNVLL